MKKSRSIPKPVRGSDVPATSAMLYEMEERLTHKMEAGFHSLRSEFRSELRGEVGPLKSNMSSIKSDLSSIKSELHRVALLVEDQNARNKFVMDGYAQMYELIQTKLRPV